MSRYWRRRLARHAILAALTAVIGAAVAFLSRDGITVFRLSMGSAYASLTLLAFALLLGPWNVARRMPNPVSFDLRRDVGLWSAIAGVVHVVCGLQVHIPGRMLEYFVNVERGEPTGVRLDLFGATNWLGVLATLVLLVLVAISNDASLRVLGATRWKALQRSNYVLFGAVVVHGAAYQILERRTLPWLIVGAVVVLGVVAAQLLGRRRYLGIARARLPGETPRDDPPSQTRQSSPAA